MELPDMCTLLVTDTEQDDFSDEKWKKLTLLWKVSMPFFDNMRSRSPGV